MSSHKDPALIVPYVPFPYSRARLCDHNGATSTPNGRGVVSVSRFY